MSASFPELKVEVLVSSAWVDLTPDVVRQPGLKCSYGITGTSARDCVASTGPASFALNNTTRNSAGLQGYYSPDHTNRMTGWVLGAEVRISWLLGSVRYYKWRGYIAAINPAPGIHNTWLVQVLCVDWMDRAARAKISGLAVQTNKRGDELFALLVACVPTAPPATMALFGVDVYPYAFDNIKDESTQVLSELQSMAQSGLDKIYQRGDIIQGGTLVYESRLKRARTTASLFTLDSSVVTAMSVTRSVSDVINSGQVQTHPRRVDATNTTVLFSEGNAPLMPRGITTVFTAQYRDPLSGRATRVGGIDMISPVATTDYLLNSLADGTGTDLTSQLTVTAITWGNSAEVTVVNNGPLDGYRIKCQLRGRGLYDFETMTFTVKDSASIAAYGENSFSLDMKYQTDPDVGADACAYIVNQCKDPRTKISSVTFIANRSTAMMQAALGLEISDRVTVTEEVTGISSDYFINAVGLDLNSSEILRCTWTLAPADSQKYWQLEVDGYTELDETTILGYGFMVPVWQLGVSQLGIDTILG